MSEQIILLIGTLGGAVVGALSGISITWISKIYDENRSRRELILKAATDNWKVSSELVEKISSKLGKGATFYPLDDFIVHHAKLADILMKKRIKPEDLEKALQEAEELENIMARHRET